MSDGVQDLLRRWRNGERDAADRLVEAMYGELRRIAAGLMRQERPDHTLGATALVHEAYLRLRRRTPLDVESSQAFLALMAVQMRRQLIDHGRRRKAVKRGGLLGRVVFDDDLHGAMADPAAAARLLGDMDAAIDRLAAEHPRVAEALRLRFLAQLSPAQAAGQLGVSIGTLNRDLRFGRSWLARAMEDASG